MVVATENQESSPDSEDWVLRRTPKACRLCRKKKVRWTLGTSGINQQPPTPPGHTTENATYTVQKPPTPPDAAAGAVQPIDRDVDAIADTINCADHNGSPDQIHAVNQLDQDMSSNIFDVHQNGHNATDPYHPHDPPNLDTTLDYQNAQYCLMDGDSPSISLLDCALLSVNDDYQTLIDPNLQSGDIPDETNPNSDIAEAANGSMDIDSSSMEASQNIDLEEDIGHSLQSTLVGHMKYMGPSMSFIPATRLGQEWITRVTGSSYFSTQLQTFLREWTPINSALDLHLSYDYTVMPSYETALDFVHCYFATVQSAFPILDEKEFIDHLETSYSTLMPSEDPTWFK
ncbi:hypothetical protein G7Z17_g2514 [Cylindrodendrum hubeiense]|uniref:Uncharacterized protein n=1 Tax=Cylindrodendrum hubeiense TaxID=595255 RepID=A0A9P5LJ34_9HYPO|nr:hypothetical protein G7Z17_g2514 [Cylindrodendrum hubeiense]